MSQGVPLPWPTWFNPSLQERSDFLFGLRREWRGQHNPTPLFKGFEKIVDDSYDDLTKIHL